ncbi:MAG: amidohydrolase [Rhizorhabdus sp.]|uniref:amidohydrolase family protein n=1 Tax=Rhizorhabdus sp. TaxID=1968843 RepID=UPI001B76B7DD|nr:amidohydrolase family protein [Rhizorhabdus sp.]MBP8234598.1 amidohydrolase [Rhizorhabdus sp.]
MPLGSSRLISADSHFNEPGDLFTKRVAAKFKDRAPRMESFPEGDGWIFEGLDGPRNFGWNACAGLPPEDMKAWMRFEDMRKGGWDPAERVKEQDRDGVTAEVMYPTPSIQAAIALVEDEEFHLALVRAYNDWVSEYVAYDPSRFCGLVYIPNRGGVKVAVEEMDRVLGRPGMRAVMSQAYPTGTTVMTDEHDYLWAAIHERDVCFNIHVALGIYKPSPHKAKLPGYGRFFDAPNRCIEFIFNGVFDRFPNLKVAFAEVDFGWVPYVKEQIDNNYQRLEKVSNFGLKRLPSEYIDEHFYFGYMTDSFGLDNLSYMNPERVLWSTDYPHISADYPYSWRTIQASMAGVPGPTKAAILHGNAEKLYKFPAAEKVETRPKLAAA